MDDDDGVSAMNPQIEMPTYNEWLVYLQRMPEQAAEKLARLQAEVVQHGWENVATAAIMSLRGYDRAKSLIELAASDVVKEQKLTEETLVGQHMFGPYPNQKQWADLIDTKPAVARQIVFALELKVTSLGMSATEDLRRSINDYYMITDT